MMNIVNFEKTNCIINEYIAELRDVNVQTDRMRFRRNLERLGEAMAYEISKVLEYKSVTVSTPLGSKDVNLLLTVDSDSNYPHSELSIKTPIR